MSHPEECKCGVFHELGRASVGTQDMSQDRSEIYINDRTSRHPIYGIFEED